MVSIAAPVALFAYRRPDHLEQCLRALRANSLAEHTELVVFCDGPRTVGEEVHTAAVRALAKAAHGFASVRVVEAPANRGLARSIIDGVSSMLVDHERVIVVEDDLVTSPDFLQFMNEALEMYADDAAVVSVHGFSIPTPIGLPQTYFLRGADCWGWATWRRGWSCFNPDGSALLDRLRSAALTDKFDLDGAYPYTEMLERQVEGQIDSWAIRWHASAFLEGHLTLYPGRSLVENIGQEGSGTHSQETRTHTATAGRFDFPLIRIPIEESTIARAAIVRALSREHASLWRRIRIAMRGRRP